MKSEKHLIAVDTGTDPRNIWQFHSEYSTREEAEKVALSLNRGKRSTVVLSYSTSTIEEVLKDLNVTEFEGQMLWEELEGDIPEVKYRMTNGFAEYLLAEYMVTKG